VKARIPSADALVVRLSQPVRMLAPIPAVELETTRYARWKAREGEVRFGAETRSRVRFPHRPIDEIMDDVVAERWHEIASIEWFVLVRNLDAWLSRQTQRPRFEVGERIWSHARGQFALRRALVLCSINTLFRAESDQRLQLPRCLRDGIRYASRWESEEGLFLAALSGADAYEPLLDGCMQRWETPTAFGMRVLGVRLPQGTTDNVLLRLGSVVHRNRHRFDAQLANWIEACLNDGSTHARAALTSRLLEQLPREAWSAKGVGRLANWVRKHALQSSEDSLWSELSEEAQRQLKTWLGEITYQDFETIVQHIAFRGIAGPLSDAEVNQLRKRISFWKNYTGQFERMRLLLPKATYLAVKNSGLLQKMSSSVSPLCSSSGEYAMEVAIFSTQEFIIVEFLRSDAECRILLYDRELADVLFDEDVSLSVHHLRLLGTFEVCEPLDHKYIWQSIAYETLLALGVTLDSPNAPVHFFELQADGSTKSWALLVKKPSDTNWAERGNGIWRWRGVGPYEREALSQPLGGWAARWANPPQAAARRIASLRKRSARVRRR
jgi:hypothetical protein